MALVLTEVVGGAALMLGLFTRLAAVPPAFSMLVATVLVHLPNGFFSSSGGVEFTLLLTVACVALALTGPGKASLDHFLARLGGPLRGERNLTEAPAREMATGGDYARVPHRVGRREEAQVHPPREGGDVPVRLLVTGDLFNAQHLEDQALPDANISRGNTVALRIASTAG